MKTEINPAVEGAVNIRDLATVCGAKGARGSICMNPREPGRPKCRLHGGAPGSGAPLGKHNGRYVNGDHTKEAKAERRWLRDVLAGREGETKMRNGRTTKSGNEVSLAPAPTGAPRKKRTYAQVYQSGDGGQFDIRPEPGVTRREWVGRLREALGSNSNAFVEANLRRIMAACTLPRQPWPTSTSVSAALALIESLEPENEIQATVAVHIACFDAASMNVLSRLAWSSTESRTKVSANAATKLERAFLAAVNTYDRLKRGNQQVIRIERIDMHSGAQAIVGQVVNK